MFAQVVCLHILATLFAITSNHSPMTPLDHRARPLKGAASHGKGTAGFSTLTQLIAGAFVRVCRKAAGTFSKGVRSWVMETAAEKAAETTGAARVAGTPETAATGRAEIRGSHRARGAGTTRRVRRRSDADARVINRKEVHAQFACCSVIETNSTDKEGHYGSERRR